MGGYTGDQQAYLLREGEKDWAVIDIDKGLSHETCIKLCRSHSYLPHPGSESENEGAMIEYAPR